MVDCLVGIEGAVEFFNALGPLIVPLVAYTADLTAHWDVRDGSKADVPCAKAEFVS
jgi:hypothetical protein